MYDNVNIIFSSTLLEYEGYYAELSYEDNRLIGKLLCIKDAIYFEPRSLENVNPEFARTVHEYLNDCKEVGKEPEKITRFEVMKYMMSKSIKAAKEVQALTEK